MMQPHLPELQSSEIIGLPLYMRNFPSFVEGTKSEDADKGNEEDGNVVDVDRYRSTEPCVLLLFEACFAKKCAAAAA